MMPADRARTRRADPKPMRRCAVPRGLPCGARASARVPRSSVRSLPSRTGDALATTGAASRSALVGRVGMSARRGRSGSVAEVLLQCAVVALFLGIAVTDAREQRWTTLLYLVAGSVLLTTFLT